MHVLSSDPGRRALTRTGAADERARYDGAAAGPRNNGRPADAPCSSVREQHGRLRRVGRREREGVV